MDKLKVDAIVALAEKHKNSNREEFMQLMQPLGGEQALVEAVAHVEAELPALEAQHNALLKEKRLIEGHLDWLHSAPFVLQKNECSRAHKLLESLMTDPERSKAAEAIKTATPFVVCHDWLATMGAGALDDYAGAIKLPYESCFFEFKVNDRPVLIYASQTEGLDPKAQPFMMLGNEWYCGGEEDCGVGSAFHFLWLQVVAICAVLDAAVATHTVQRAPQALNKKREKAGKPALYDFHIVDLAKRARAAPSASSSDSGSRKRLHFRRGHWRHFEASKSWVRWCLVGDPDLGFIAKEYRL